MPTPSAVVAPALGVGTVLLLVTGEVSVGRATAAAELAFVAHGSAVGASLLRLATVAARAAVALGLYASATRLQLVGAILVQAATRLAYPRFFRAADRGALGFFTRAVAFPMALVGLLALAVTALAAQLLPLVLGPAYAGLTPLATGLALACPFVALQYPAADALTAAGRQGLRTLLTVLAAVASAALLAGGAALAGAAGAAAGFVVGQAALAAALWLAFARTCR